MAKPLKKVSLTLFGLIALILLNAPLISADDAQFLLYQNKEYQIEILYPKSWRIAEETLGAQVIFLSPLESDEDKFSENLNIIIMKVRQIDDLETICQNSIIQLSRFITNFKLISYEKTYLSGQESRLLLYTGEQQGFKLQFLQVIMKKDDIIYIITFTAEEKAFARYLSTAKFIIDSFKIK